LLNGLSARAPRAPLVDARELAGMLGVSRNAVYEHARDLGGIRIGGARSGRLRFDPEVAIRAARAPLCPESPPSDSAPRRNSRGLRRLRPARHPFLEPNAVWDAEVGLWRDQQGYPTHDQCWRSTGTGAHGLVAQGPNDEPGATHIEWELSRRECRKEHRQRRYRVPPLVWPTSAAVLPEIVPQLFPSASSHSNPERSTKGPDCRLIHKR
jgi:hypothetical protein